VINHAIRKSPKKVKEENLYYPIVEALKGIFDRWYVDESYVYTRDGIQRAPTSGITNPHLIITAHGEFSDELQRVLDYRLFAALYAEKLKPDIMGFVRKKKSSEPEVITVEVKATALTIRDVLQAKMYSDIFNAKFAFIISPEGISIPKLRTILEHDKSLRGNVIIAKYNPKVTRFQIYRELKEFVPKEFQRFCE
jgi:hypothetical protein